MKKLLFLIVVLGVSIMVSGCLKKDTMENIDIYTTIYPIEYITNILYGDNGNIYSIYPNNVDVYSYTLTDKQLTDYSKSGLFIYNGLSKEKDYAIKMLNKNRKLKIIDAAMNMEFSNGLEEIWLDPSNFLMLSQNIKEGFDEYITNPYLKNEINDNYDNLKIDISEIDAEFKLIAENSVDKTIVVSNNLFKFLEKYNIKVISLEDDELTQKAIADVKKLMADDKIDYIYMIPNEDLEGTEEASIIDELINNYKVETITFNTISNLTEAERNEKFDFIKIMNDNIDLLKKELYE